MTALTDHPGHHAYETMRLSPDLAAHERRFAAALDGVDDVAVAFSGGVDSSVTVALAARLLGRGQVVAVLGISPSLSDVERRQAHVTADTLGVACVEVHTHELEDPDYVANQGNRCYFCKFELYTRAFGDGISDLGCEVLLNGDTADDHLVDDRPGKRAAEELGVRSPLAEAAIGKEAVRALAFELGLAVWDKPSAPCLASRVPVNIPVTREGLGQIERAEDALRALGMRNLRVRHLGSAARVELGEAEAELLDAPGMRAEVLEAVTDAGYREVELSDTVLRRS